MRLDLWRVAVLLAALTASAAQAVTLRVANQGDAQAMDPHALNEALQLSLLGNVYEPLAGIVHLAAWRARGKETGMTDRELTVVFPDEIGLAMGIDIDVVLQQDPIDWTQHVPGHAF